MSEVISTDVAIVGAGPIGLFAVFELGLLDMKCHLIDILPKPGGQCAELYPEKPIYDIPGFPIINGQELVDNLMKQIHPFGPKFHLGEMVERLEVAGDGGAAAVPDRHRQRQDDRGQGRCSSPPAAGRSSRRSRRSRASTPTRTRASSIPCARWSISGRRVVIVGGGDSALDWALNLHPVASRITLIHRRDAFRAAPHSVNAMRALVDAARWTSCSGR